MKSEKQITIYINTLPVHDKSGGIKTFLLELLYALAETGEKEFSYQLICSDYNHFLFDKLLAKPNFKKIIVNCKSINPLKRIFFEQFKLNRLIQQKGDAILLNICNVAVMHCNIPQVTILQAPLSISSLRKKMPRKYVYISSLHKIYYDLLVNRSIRISKKTVAVSHYMTKFIKEIYVQRIVVIHEGVNLSWLQNNTGSKINLPEKFILSVSTLFPYKNMDKLIMAFGKFSKISSSYKLVIAGRDPDGNQIPYLQKIAQESGVLDSVIFLGMVPYDQIPLLYQKADLFLFLSSIETFGLPVLEAMGAGVPVIASNCMSIPEVVNDAGILVNPNDTDVIATKMQDILFDAERRKEYIRRGKENIKLFSWSNTTNKFENIFRNVLVNMPEP